VSTALAPQPEVPSAPAAAPTPMSQPGPAPPPAGTPDPARASIGLLLFSWVVVVIFGMGLVIYGFGPFFHGREQRSLLSTYRVEIDHSAAAGSGLQGAAVATKPPEVGDAVAILEISGVGLQEVAVEGVSSSQTRRGPGHVPGTAGPGQPGNSVFVGRRTGFGAPFSGIKDIQLHSPIIVTTTQGQSVYDVTSVRRVTIQKPAKDADTSTGGGASAATGTKSKDAVTVDDLYGPSKKDQLTLVTSASPMPWSSGKATVVVAELQGRPYAPTPQNGRSDKETGVKGDQGALAAVILALVGYGAVMGAGVLLHRRLSLTTAYILAVAPVVALTVIAAETVSRLFPAWM
jgi:sortase A